MIGGMFEMRGTAPGGIVELKAAVVAAETSGFRCEAHGLRFGTSNVGAFEKTTRLS